MLASETHAVFILHPMPLVGKPKPLVHCLEYALGLGPVGLRVLTDYLSYACRKQVAAIVVGRRMRGRAAVVVQRIARPDAAVGIVETVVVGIEVPLLPLEVKLYDRPHLAHVGSVRVIREVPEQLIDVV